MAGLVVVCAAAGNAKTCAGVVLIVSLDTETYLIDRANLAPRPVCMSWWADHLSPKVRLIAECKDLFRSWLEGSDTLIGAFIAFDMAVLGEYWPDLLPLIYAKYERGQIEDIQLNQKLIDIAGRGTTAEDNSLENLCKRYDLPSPDKSGPWRLEFAALDGIEIKYWPPGAVQYVLEDAERPLQIHDYQHQYDQQWAEQGGSPILHLAGTEAYKSFVLYLISCWGTKTDASRVAVLKSRLEEYLARAGKNLAKAGLVRPDGSRDTKAAKAHMTQACAGNPPLTDKGGVCMDKEACARTGDPLLQEYSDFSGSATLMARVNDLALGVDLPLQVRFDSLLETGRTSTSKPKAPVIGVQAQNFPRTLVGAVTGWDKSGKPLPGEQAALDRARGWVPGARECLEPRPGHLFVSADLPSAELRSLSQVCIKVFGDSIMGQQLNAGRDLHLWFGAQMLGLDYETALGRASEPEIKDARQSAKPCNFGFPGGMGVETFILWAYLNYRIKFGEEKAKHLKGVWLAAFPEMKEYFSWINRSMKGNDRALIKHVMSGRWRGRVPYCGACNSQFQELTANGAAAGLMEVSKRCYTVRSSALFDSRPIMFTHDEIVLETPKEICHDAAMELSAVMAERFSQWHPDVPALPCTGPGKDPRTVTPCVSRIYSKDMGPVWAGDRLAVWAPKGFEA